MDTLRQLMRLDRPAGFYASYVPYMIGALYAACTSTTASDPVDLAAFLLFLVPFNIILRGASCSWYDIIYAHQQVGDDEKAGVKSMALRFRDSTAYYVGTVGGVALASACYIYSVDLKSPASCG
jgi:4-hydroxybenzoate polyprenyltransferase